MIDAYLLALLDFKKLFKVSYDAFGLSTGGFLN